jgi:hypothetical protein
MRAPARHIIYAYLFLAILVGIGVRYLLYQRRREGSARWVVVLAIAILFIDFYSFSSEVTTVALPPAYQAIERQGSGAILDLPEAVLNFPMLYQTIHGLPVVGGVPARKLEKSLVDRLELDDLDIQRQQLVKYHVKYIVIHKEYLNWKPPLDTLAYDNEYSRLFSDNTEVVYDVDGTSSVP